MSQQDQSPISILLVDDESDLADLAAEFLERENDRFRVETTTDAPTGLDRIAKTQYDCIVSDFEMPQMDGLEFLKAIRNIHPNLPFILYTGKGSEEVASEAISAGVSDYLQKDAGTEQYELLANRIVNAVAQFRAERRAESQERVLTLLRDVNQALVSASTRTEIETDVTDIIVSTEQYQAALIAECDVERDRLVPRTIAGFDGGRVEPQPISLANGSDDVVAEIIETQNLGIVRSDDPTVEVWGDDRVGFEYGAAAILPLSYHGDLMGVFVLYAQDSACFNQAEREMLNEICGDMAQAIHTAETHQSLKRHRTAVETVPEGVFILDEDARIVIANEAAAGLADRSPEAVVGKPFPIYVEEGIFDEEIIEWYLDSVREMLSSSIDRDEARYTTTIVRPDGEERVVEIHLSLRPYEEDFRGTAGIIRDVTEQKQRERELEESRARYRRLVENAPIPIAIYDRDGDLVYVNDSAVEFIRAPDQEALLGQPAFDLVHPSDRETATERMKRVLERRQQAPPTELSILDRAGERKEVIVSTVPIEYDGEPAGQVVIENVTEQKKRAQALERQRNRLDSFASMLSHDLRNPLNVALGQVELAQAGGNGDHLEKVAGALERMERMIEDLLPFTRVGDTAIDEEVAGLRDLAESSWRNVETSDATLKIDQDGELYCDSSRVQRMFENLFRNAIEHGDHDVTITVGTFGHDFGIYVEDDGPGIPEARRTDVFQFGYSTNVEGTGLGLAIVREIAEAHGWEISVTEGEKGGARFEVTGVTTRYDE